MLLASVGNCNKDFGNYLSGRSGTSTRTPSRREYKRSAQVLGFKQQNGNKDDGDDGDDAGNGTRWADIYLSRGGGLSKAELAKTGAARRAQVATA